MSNRPPAWMAALIAHVNDCGGMRRGIQHVEIRHDDDCSHFDGRSCDCNPDVVSGPMIDSKYRKGGDR